MEAARLSKLPRKVTGILAEGKRYPEGAMFRMDVAGAGDISAIVKLAAINLQHGTRRGARRARSFPCTHFVHHQRDAAPETAILKDSYTGSPRTHQGVS